MSENPEVKPGSVEQRPTSQPDVPQLRSLFILRATAEPAPGASKATQARYRRRQRRGGDPGFGHQDTSPGGASDGTGRKH